MAELNWIPVDEEQPTDCEEVIISCEEYRETDEEELKLIKELRKNHGDFDLWVTKNVRRIGDETFIVYPICLPSVYFTGEPDEDGYCPKAGFATFDECVDLPENLKVIAWMPFPDL